MITFMWKLWKNKYCEGIVLKSVERGQDVSEKIHLGESSLKTGRWQSILFINAAAAAEKACCGQFW